MTRRWSLYHQRVMRLIDHHVAGTKRQLKPNTSPYHLTVKLETQQLGDIHMTYGRTWKIGQVRPDRSMDRGGAPKHMTMTVIPDTLTANPAGPNTTSQTQPDCIVT